MSRPYTLRGIHDVNPDGKILGMFHTIAEAIEGIRHYWRHTVIWISYEISTEGESGILYRLCYELVTAPERYDGSDSSQIIRLDLYPDRLTALSKMKSVKTPKNNLKPWVRPIIMKMEDGEINFHSTLVPE